MTDEELKRKQAIEQILQAGYSGTALQDSEEMLRRQQEQQDEARKRERASSGTPPVNPSMFAGGGAAAAPAAEGGAGASAGSASSGGSSLAAAGPWAALAAVIIANEHNAKKGGYRDEDNKEYAIDLLDGKVVEQDMNQRWLPKMFGKDMQHDSTGLGSDMKAGTEFATLDFKNGFKAVDDGTIGKSVRLGRDVIKRGIGKLFG